MSDKTKIIDQQYREWLSIDMPLGFNIDASDDELMQWFLDSLPPNTHFIESKIGEKPKYEPINDIPKPVWRKI